MNVSLTKLPLAAVLSSPPPNKPAKKPESRNQDTFEAAQNRESDSALGKTLKAFALLGMAAGVTACHPEGGAEVGQEISRPENLEPGTPDISQNPTTATDPVEVKAETSLTTGQSMARFGGSSEYYWNNGYGEGSEYYWENGYGEGSEYYWENGYGEGSEYYWENGYGAGSEYYWKNGYGAGSEYYWENGYGEGSEYYWNNGYGSGVKAPD